MTLKSLSSQTDKDFLYVLAIAHDTSKDYRRRIRSLLEKYLPKNHALVLVTLEQTHYPCTNSALLIEEAGAELLKPFVKADEYGHVFTTHIGTDDALSGCYVAACKDAYDWSEFAYHGFINYKDGYVCFTDKVTFYAVDDTKYFFLTYREPVESFKSVLYHTHDKVHRHTPVIHPASESYVDQDRPPQQHCVLR